MTEENMTEENLPTYLLEARGLTKSFGGLRALNGVNFSVSDRGIHALIGANGAGKTTFVNILAGYAASDSGKIMFGGDDITHLPIHRRVRRGLAYSFQVSSLFLGLSVYDNLLIPIQRRLQWEGLSLFKHLHGEVGVILESLSFGGVGGEVCVGDLSYGHRRLLELYMALSLRPRLLILDEPTQGLAMDEVINFKHIIRHFSASSSVVLIEHNMDVVMDLADMVTVFDFGEVLEVGVPDFIRSSGRVRAAYLGGSSC